MKVTLTTITTQTKISENYPELIEKFHLIKEEDELMDVWSIPTPSLELIEDTVNFINADYDLECYLSTVFYKHEMCIVIDDSSKLEGDADA